MIDKEFKGCGCESTSRFGEVDANSCIAPALVEALEALTNHSRHCICIHCEEAALKAKSALAAAYGETK